MSDLCLLCGNPEDQHVWIYEAEITLWRPEPGFKKNSCARRPDPGSDVLQFKVWSPQDEW